MTQRKGLLLLLVVAPLAAIQLALFLTAAAWLHMFISLEIAKGEGVYATPEDGMRVLASESWIDVERVDIGRAGPNAFDGSNPHVWFVTAHVWADGRADGKPLGRRGYGSAGSFFLRTEDGWVHVPEGRFPEFIGHCMRLFDYWG